MTTDNQPTITEKTVNSIANRPINSRESVKPWKSALRNAKEGIDNKYKIKLSNIGQKSICECLEDYQNVSHDNQSLYGQSIDLDVVKPSSIFDTNDSKVDNNIASDCAKSTKQFEEAKDEEHNELYKHGKKARFVRKMAKKMHNEISRRRFIEEIYTVAKTEKLQSKSKL